MDLEQLEQLEEHCYKQRTQQALLQKETVEKDSVSCSPNLDLNKSLSDFVLDESATLTAKQSETIAYNSYLQS